MCRPNVRKSCLHSMEALFVAICPGGTTPILPKILQPFHKTTNPVFEQMFWMDDVPIGASIIITIMERVKAEGLGVGGTETEDVVFVHGKATLKPWVHGDYRWDWVDLVPKTKTANDRGPVVNVTLKVHDRPHPGVLEAQAFRASAPYTLAPVEEMSVHSDDSFKMGDMEVEATLSLGVEASASASSASASASSASASALALFSGTFAIDAVMQKYVVNLWMDVVLGSAHPIGLATSPMRNYNALAIGFDFEKGDYPSYSLAKGFSDTIVPLDIDGIIEGLEKYARLSGEQGLGVEASGAGVALTWAKHIKPRAQTDFGWAPRVGRGLKRIPQIAQGLN